MEKTLLPRIEALNAEKYNPKGSYWSGQAMAVATIFGAIHDGYKIIGLSAPTGSGKSIINSTIANLLDGSHILTTQKKLQDQYLELGSDFKRVTGRGNFTCKSDPRKTCEDGMCITQDKFSCPYRPDKNGIYPAFADKKWYGTEHCGYWHNVAEAWNAKHTIFNYAYYVLKMNSDYNEFQNATVQILDEGHNLEDYVRNVTSFEITDRSLYHVQYADTIDTFNTKYEKVERQINQKQDAIQWLKALIEVVELRIADTRNHRSEYAGNRIRKLENLAKRTKNVIRLYEDRPENWVFMKLKNGFKLVPLEIQEYAKDVIFSHADISIFSSATLPAKSVLCKRFGFSEDEVFYYEMPSPFDPEKAPIFSYPQPTMTYSKDMTFKRNQMGGAIASVIREYEGVRGLILCNSYTEVEYYEQYLAIKCPDCYERLIVHNRGDNAETLYNDLMWKENGVLLSPSLWEGLDLKGNMGEFLIIAKVPYPDFSDPVIQGLKEIDKNRYFEDTVMKIRQGVGRVIRSVDDEADIHILDGAFRQIYKFNKKLFPQDFIDRVVYI